APESRTGFDALADMVDQFADELDANRQEQNVPDAPEGRKWRSVAIKRATNEQLSPKVRSAAINRMNADPDTYSMTTRTNEESFQRAKKWIDAQESLQYATEHFHDSTQDLDLVDRTTIGVLLSEHYAQEFEATQSEDALNQHNYIDQVLMKKGSDEGRAVQMLANYSGPQFWRSAPATLVYVRTHLAEAAAAHPFIKKAQPIIDIVWKTVKTAQESFFNSILSDENAILRKQIQTMVQREAYAKSEREAYAKLEREQRKSFESRYGTNTDQAKYKEVVDDIVSEGDKALAWLEERMQQKRGKMETQFSAPEAGARESTIDNDVFLNLVRVAQADAAKVTPKGRRVDWPAFRQAWFDKMAKTYPQLADQLGNALDAAEDINNKLFDQYDDAKRQRKPSQNKPGRKPVSEIVKQKPQKLTPTELQDWAKNAGITTQQAEAALQTMREEGVPALWTWANEQGLTGEQIEAVLKTVREDQNPAGALAQWAKDNNTVAPDAALFTDMYDSLSAAEVAAKLSPSETQSRTRTPMDEVRARRRQIERQGLLAWTLSDINRTPDGRRMGVSRIIQQAIAGPAGQQINVLNGLKERLIDTGFSPADSERLAKTIETEYSKLVDQEMRGILFRRFLSDKAQTRTAQDKDAINNIVMAAQTGMLTDDKIAEAFNKAYGLKTLTPGVRERIMELQQAIKAAEERTFEESNDVQAAQDEMRAYIYSLTPYSFWRAYWSLSKAGLLMAGKTVAKNVVSTAFQFENEVNAKAVVAISKGQWGDLYLMWLARKKAFWGQRVDGKHFGSKAWSGFWRIILEKKSIYGHGGKFGAERAIYGDPLQNIKIFQGTWNP
ncbi:MAG: hypothetical protein ABIH03_04560, partial [Pseudomonadota bacterium]